MSDVTPRQGVVLFSPRKMMSSGWKLPLSQEFRSNVVDVQPKSGLEPFASGNDLLVDQVSGRSSRRGDQLRQGILVLAADVIFLMQCSV